MLTDEGMRYFANKAADDAEARAEAAEAKARTLQRAAIGFGSGLLLTLIGWALTYFTMRG